MSQQYMTWHQACGLCKDSACETIDKLRGTKDFTVREACRYLSEQLEGEIGAEAFRRMYYRHRKKEEPKEPTIDELLERARKYIGKLLQRLERTEEEIDEHQLSTFIRALQKGVTLAETCKRNMEGPGGNND
ncbi:MAG: hypothetical protein JSU72_13170 [Deltaproteobacteria bacterium]|nr:MAG: hypothetical protein JSU72_13170 [Deltaproteobacteria bacterium]